MNRLTVRRSIIAFLCYSCLIVPLLSVSAQGQQQSPPIWDREGIPPANKKATDKSAEPAKTVKEEVKWERYNASDEEFSVLLPAQPSISSISRPLKLLEERKAGRLYATYADGTVYIILSLDNPNRKESLDVFIDEFQKYPVSHSNPSFERDVALDGYQGKQYRVTAGTTGDISGIVQFYLAKNHAYIFEVVSDKIDDPSVKRFLTSFTLKGKAKGKDIAETASSSTTKVGTASPESDTNQSIDQSKVMSPKDVVRKAVVVTRPEPQYTEEARKNQISGTVVLRAVFSQSGDVTGIRPTVRLPYGLTEKAIAAATRMKFIPAVKDGRYVSQYVQIEYNFNLY